MNFIASQNPDGTPVNLYYEDWGTGSPVVFIHGWPLDHQMWEHQTRSLPEMGLRCIAYDRRGFGKSDKPWDGYDYDTFADDLKAVLDQLDLQDVTLVGFSMGGGEVVRYFSRHGGKRVSKVVLLASITPFTLQTQSNPQGVPMEVLHEMIGNIQEDRASFLTGFSKMFYGVNLISHQVSQSTLDWNLVLAMQASPKATIDCIHAFGETDFRTEMHTINVPTLIIHGESDKIVPIEATGEQAARLIPGSKYIVYEDAPHGLFVTNKEELNADLLEFIGAKDIPAKTASNYKSL
ncbi:MAG: alpha/beta hydrolase [Sphingobacteriaceae bacterium]|nr:alpha/beta hydrolase [Sphingobacteriaceae bacterium]